MSRHKVSFFSRFAKSAATITGKSYVFASALVILVLWAATGPAFGFSDTWQLVINTGTTIVTFLMVFLIQNTQNRDTEAIQIKLDELIKNIAGTREEMMDLEELDEKELANIRKEYLEIAEKAREELESRQYE